MPVRIKLALSNPLPRNAQAIVLEVSNEDSGKCGGELRYESRMKSRRWKFAYQS